MSSFAKRCMTAIIAVPVIFSLIFFFPQLHHIGFFFLVLLVSLIGSYEMKDLVTKSEGIKPYLPFWAPSILVVSAWAENYYDYPLVDFTLILLALVTFFMEIVYGPTDNFLRTPTRVGSSILMIVYPGFFITFLVRISELPYNSLLLFLFFLLVFGNDTFAYIFGMTLGKNNRGILKVSPNKSIAGFIGGTVVAVIIGGLYCTFNDIGIALWQGLLLGFLISVSANVGDLIESVFKRSAHVKDSGTIIPGRGGLLDSIDSLLASAPLFWILYVLFYL